MKHTSPGRAEADVVAVMTALASGKEGSKWEGNIIFSSHGSINKIIE